MKNIFNKMLSTLIIVAITMSLACVTVSSQTNITLTNINVGSTIYDGNGYSEFIMPTVETAGVYAVSANLRSGDGTGHLKIAVKNNPGVAFLEFKGNTANEFATVESEQYLYLDAGENTLLVKNHGRGDGYRNYVGWQDFTFTYVSDKTIADVTIDIEAEAWNSYTAEPGVREFTNAKVVTQAQDNCLSYTAFVPVAGQYMLVASTINSLVNSGYPVESGFVTFNGEKTNFSYDYTGKTTTNFVDVRLGTLNLSEGENQFSVTPTSYRFYPDYYMLIKVGEYIPEYNYNVVNTGAEHLHSGTAANVLTVNIEKEGVYSVIASLDDRNVGGRVKITANSQVVAYEFKDAVDGYQEYGNIGYLYLEKGENKIYVQNDGKGANEVFHNYIKFESLKLDYVSDKTKTDCMWLAEAENADIQNSTEIQPQGNAQILAFERGDSATISITVPEDGEYVLYANARNNHQSGTPIATGTVTYNEKVTSFSADYSEFNSTIFKDIKIGAFSLSKGINYISIKLDAAYLSVDYLMIKTFVYETHYKVANNTSEFMAYNADSPVEVVVEIEKEGVYSVTASLDDRNVGGRIKITANSQIIGYEFVDDTDGYNEHRDIGYLYLESGINKIYIQNDGKGEHAVFHNYMKCNYIELDYEKNKSVSDCKWLAEAENAYEANGENQTIIPETIGVISTVKIDETKILTLPVNVPRNGKYKLVANVRNNHMSTPIFSGGVTCRDITVPFEADFTGLNSTIYKDIDLGILDMTKGVNTVTLKLNSSLITIDYIMAFEYVEYEPLVASINSAVTLDAVKAIMEANKDVFVSYDTVIAGLFYPDALYEQFLSRNFADLDSLKAKWTELSNGTPIVDLQIKKVNDADFIGGKKKLESGVAQVVVNPYKVENGILAISTVYENGMLISIDNAIANGNPLTLSLGDLTIDDKKQYTFKLMYWDSLEGMCPYIKDLKENYIINVDSQNGNDNFEGSNEAPLSTLSEAINRAADYAKKYDNDIEIRLSSGEHFISEPINITNEDFARNKLTITGDDETIVSGGKYIEGSEWIKEGNFYVATLDENIKDVRELYINGVGATRARTSNAVKMTGDIDADIDEEGNLVSSKGFKVSKTGLTKSELSAIELATDLEAIMDISWVRQRVKVDSCKVTSGIWGVGDSVEVTAHESFGVQFSEVTKADWILPIYTTPNKTYKGTSGNGTNYWAEEKKVYFENALGLCDSEGEFYFDKTSKKLYYYPNENETVLNAAVPVTEGFINIEGTPQDKLSDITISDIDFKYGTWLLPSKECIITSQAGRRYGNKRMFSQINVNWAENVSIKNVKMENISSGAIDFFCGVTNSQITDCTFNNIGASAISVGPFVQKTAQETMCKNISVCNNKISKIGYVYGGHPAITLYYVNNTKALHNDIYDTTYTGINLGWGWGKNVEQCAQNEIAYNKITNVMNVYQDGGFIYTLGDCHESTIHDNYMSGMERWGGGLYFDSGSANITATNNVLLECSKTMPNKVLSGWLMTTILENTNIIIDTVYTDDTEERTTENISISNVKTSDYDDEVAQIFANAGIENK